jgi:hypothetical protein
MAASMTLVAVKLKQLRIGSVLLSTISVNRMTGLNDLL